MGEGLKDIAIRLNAIIDTAIDGVITIDEYGIIESVNASAARLFQYNAEEIIGKKINILMPSPHNRDHDTYIQNYLESRNPKIIGQGREVTGIKKDGTEFHFRLAVSEVALDHKTIFTGIIHDLTEVKKAEDELIRLNDKLEQKVEERTVKLEEVINILLETNRDLAKSQRELNIALSKEKELSELKSRFVSMASHEFRTPLSTILSSVALLSRYVKSDTNPKVAKHIGRIKEAVSNLTGILDDFLSLSKLEEGKVETNREAVIMSKLCMDVADELKGLLKSGQVIRYSSEGKEEIVMTDQRILRNILFNLFSNAMKYSDENMHIDCHLFHDVDKVVISITDYGIGIPKEEQKYLFDRFFRATNAETIQGTGLGLNIVKRYINLLNGSINFESREGVGSTFYVSIPKK